MSLQMTDLQGTGQRFPRVSGDEPQISLDAWRDGVFSPRERG